MNFSHLLQTKTYVLTFLTYHLNFALQMIKSNNKKISRGWKSSLGKLLRKHQMTYTALFNKDLLPF